MTSYAVVPARSLYRVDSSVSAHIAALAEPLACVVSATQKLKVQPGATVVVLGAGPIGLLYTTFLNTTFLKACEASKIIVSEISEYRRRAALDCGATLAVNFRSEDLESAVQREMKGGADVVVGAVGLLLPQAI